MKILVACEESQTVTKAFRALGHEAYSCDIQECSGGYPEWHIVGDAIDVAYNQQWDLMIAHPPCTYLTVTGARWLYNKDGTKNEQRWKDRADALDFVQKLMDAPIERIAIENPVGAISTEIRKPEQYIEPCMFGDTTTKKTGLWLKNLKPLEPTNIVEPEFVTLKDGKRYSKWYYETSCLPVKDGVRAKARSKTFQGIADAMASQWGNE